MIYLLVLVNDNNPRLRNRQSCFNHNHSSFGRTKLKTNMVATIAKTYGYEALKSQACMPTVRNHKACLCNYCKSQYTV